MMKRNKYLHKNLLVFSALMLMTLLQLSSFASYQSSMLSVNYRNLVSRADLTYEKPVLRAEDGLPIGNGTTGSLIWTSPSAIKLQINRVDVFANNSYTNSFNRRDWDYAFGCGFIDIDFVDYGPDVFTDENTKQHLSVYDALASINAEDVTAKILVWNDQDVFALRITDNRKNPTSIKTNLRMMRHLAKSFPGQESEYIERKTSVVKTKNHTATSKLHIRGDRIVLTQKFEEGDYYCASAVAVAVVGRDSKPKIANVTEARLAAEPANGQFTILISSAATFDRDEDIIAAALKKLDKAAEISFDQMLESNKKWWHEYWSKAFVQLRSDDGAAQLVEQSYNYFLYIMAASSRGKIAPRYGGMIFNTEGDYHHWGSQFWWNNVSFYYKGFMPSNRLEIMDPMFNMYFNMAPSCAVAARQQWGSKGIFIPEAGFFDGLEKLPDDIADEMRQLYLLRKPWSKRSQRFRDFADAKHPHNGSWNWKDYGSWVDGKWVYQDKGQGPYGHCVHLLSANAKIAFLFWQRYQYTNDIEFLRSKAYPMIKGAAEFYANYPNVKKGPDGKFHIYNVNDHESFRGYKQDTMDE
ncbi:MAG: glycosyl hydrolase family 95 catalytic domain-containing protein, partial [Planctomycetota bacterium]